MIHSYSTIYNLGHAAIADLLHGPVIVEEKIDGSQISFGIGMFDNQTEGNELQIRTKGQVINLVDPEKMFTRAVDYIKTIKDRLVPGYVYRAEYLSKPHHNVATYSRAPNNFLIIFDVEESEQSYLAPLNKKEAASRIGLETVPVLWEGEGNELNPDNLRTLLDKDSILGGSKIEGFVIKPAKYDLYGRDKKVLMGKFVSEVFKEKHAKEWKLEHATKSQTDVIGMLAACYTTAARWQKALAHLRDEGKITNAPQDIGSLMAAVPPDVQKECEAEIKEALFKWAWPQLRRCLTHGLPEWYKNLLLEKQFEGEPSSASDVGGTLDEPPWSPDANLERSKQVENKIP